MKNSNLNSVQQACKVGSERFVYNGQPLPFDLLSFWQWALSDLLSNALRGMLAEYIVAQALGEADGQVRVEWDACDIRTQSGLKVEVKSAAYLQSWDQKKLSDIRFDIRPTKGWDAETNTYSEKRKRQADVYVFCLLAHTDKQTINPLDLDQWRFYVIQTSILNERVAEQKTIGLEGLRSLGAVEAKCSELNAAIIHNIACS